MDVVWCLALQALALTFGWFGSGVEGAWSCYQLHKSQNVGKQTPLSDYVVINHSLQENSLEMPTENLWEMAH